MRNLTRQLLTALALILSLWIILGFWPLGSGSRIFLSAVSLLLAGCVSGYFWRQRQPAEADVSERILPPEDFEGAVVLVCGDSSALFASDRDSQETRQGWYIPVREPEQLASVAELLAFARPALISQVSLLLAVVPERWQEAALFSSQLHQWQRAVALTRRAFSGLPPVWCSVWLNSPEKTPAADYRWYFLTDSQTGIQVQETGAVSRDWRSWCADDVQLGARLDSALWLRQVFRWLNPQVLEVMNTRHHNTPVLSPRMLAVCTGPLSALPDNLWQRQLEDVTTLRGRVEQATGFPPLPDLLLSHLQRRHGVSRMMQSLRLAGLLTGLFLLLAITASWVNNQRLIQNVGDHLALYQRLSGTPPEPKLQAQNQLRRDGRLLDTWQREGPPMRYTMGLYQGLRLIPPLRAAIDGWAPPPAPQPVINTLIQGPQTVRLDSMALFDSGKSALKAGATKLLVNALVGIKAKPGWLIVVSGHTDNTGNPQLNQTLSLKRAEAVRDWMRDTGDVPGSCFAVQGYGADRPAAPNDTAEGRALNRRVEISLVPQADACQVPGDTHAPSQDDGASNLKGE